MKKLLSTILTIALLSLHIPVNAENDNIDANFTIEQSEIQSEAEIINSAENADVETEEIVIEASEEESQITTENVNNDAAIEVEEIGLSEYIHGDIYDSECTYETADEETIDLVIENDFSEYVSDEELMLQVASESSSVAGWETCGTMRTSRSDMASVVVNNNIYTFGGTEGGEIVNNTEFFNTETLIWSLKASMPEKRYKHSALYCDGNIYICAGYKESTTETTGCEAANDIIIYNVEDNAWETTNITTPNNNTNYASGIYNGELYIFGGYENGVSTTNSYKYNFDTETWTQIASMPTATFDGKAATTSYGFYILSAMDVMKYNYEENTISKVDTLPRTMMDYAFVVRNYPSHNGYSEDDVLMISGGRETASSTSLASVKVRANTDYAFTEDWVPEWYNDLRLIRGLSCHNMVEANGYIYVFGGQITADLEQRLMFRRSAFEWHDDYLDSDMYDLVNGYAYGSINYKSDVDQFDFIPEVTTKYEVKGLTAIHTNNLGYRFWITIYNEYGIPIASEIQGHMGGVTLEANKKYMIEITDPSALYTGNYYLQVHRVYDDAVDTLDNCSEIYLNRNISKTFLGIMDIDCMYFNIPQTGKYNLETTSRGDTRLYVTIKNGNGKIVYSYNYNMSEDRVHLENMRLKKGVYYISLSPSELDYSWSNQSYTFKISGTDSYKYMNKARYRHGVAAIGGKIYAFGGFNDAYGLESSIERYTPSTAMWTPFGESENVLRQGTSTIGVNSKIYLVGGVEDNSHGAMNYESLADSIMIYDTTTQQWSSSGDLGIDRERVGLVEKDGNIYIVGGRSYSPTMYSEEIQTFNIETNTLSDYTVDLPNGIVDPQVFFKDDIMYVVGGVDLEGYSDKVYALEDGIWVQKASMPYQSTYLRGKGYNGDFFGAAVNTLGNVDILKYDATSDEWKVLYDNIISSRSYYGVDVLNGLLYVVGGYSNNEDTVKNDISAYDIVTDIETMDTAIPVRTIGYEYEQTVNGDSTGAPRILKVNAKVVDHDKGIYELYLEEDDYTYDVRNTPFFFWSAREGMFTALSDDYTRVMFYADKGTGDRQVKVVVGIGDGRGYVDKKSFLLDGNSEVE